MQNSNDDVLAFVLAGGRGRRLFPLTEERTKPSVPFGGKYRIIDFTLSNLTNSGIYSIYVLVQYKSQSLIEHIRTSWRKFGSLPRHFVTVVPPQMQKEEIMQWYRGTADSIYHNINLIYDSRPRYVAIFGGDHIFRMNIKEMVDSHVQRKAQMTIAAIPVKGKDVCQFGELEVDSDFRVRSFREKPSSARGRRALASMGNYIFDADFLVEVLNKSAKAGLANDFGSDIIPQLVKNRKRVFAYDFSRNRIPNLKPYEANYYWRDVGSISSYWQANMDLLGPKQALDLDNRRWPIYSSWLECPPAYVVDSKADNSYICQGARISGAIVENSILGRSVIVEPGSVIKDSIIMDYSRIGKASKIKKAIIDRYNNIPKNSRIGYADKKYSQLHHIDPSGIVVIARGRRSAL